MTRDRLLLRGVTGLAALALAVTVAGSGTGSPWVWTIALVGVGLLALALLTRTPAAALGGLVAIAAGIVLRGSGSGLDLVTPVYGAALLVLAELVFWSIERVDLVIGTPGAPWRRLRDISVLGLGGLGAGGCVLLGAEVRAFLPIGGWRLEVGALAAVLALGLIVWAAWRRPARGDAPGTGRDQARNP